MEDVQRTKLSELVGKNIAGIAQDERGDYKLQDVFGNTFAIIKYDAMFDGEGNYFENDIG